MTDYSAEEAKKRYDSLPQEIKDLLYSSEMSFIIQQIGQKNKLHIDQIDSLNTEAGQVMLGLVEPENFVNELIDMLNLDQAHATAVAQDVEDMLLSKIRNSMKKTDEKNKIPATIAEASAPIAPTSQGATQMRKLPPLPSETAAKEVTPLKPTPPLAPTMKASPMPVSTPPTNPSTPAVPSKPMAPVGPTTQVVPPPLKPASPADVMLSQKTVEKAPAIPQNLNASAKPTPPLPKPYTKDPYREPVEP